LYQNILKNTSLKNINNNTLNNNVIFFSMLNFINNNIKKIILKKKILLTKMKKKKFNNIFLKKNLNFILLIKNFVNFKLIIKYILLFFCNKGLKIHMKTYKNVFLKLKKKKLFEKFLFFELEFAFQYLKNKKSDTAFENNFLKINIDLSKKSFYILKKKLKKIILKYKNITALQLTYQLKSFLNK
jgi:hypothetical protein